MEPASLQLLALAQPPAASCSRYVGESEALGGGASQRRAAEEELTKASVKFAGACGRAAGEVVATTTWLQLPRPEGERARTLIATVKPVGRPPSSKVVTPPQATSRSVIIVPLRLLRISYSTPASDWFAAGDQARVSEPRERTSVRFVGDSGAAGGTSGGGHVPPPPDSNPGSRKKSAATMPNAATSPTTMLQQSKRHDLACLLLHQDGRSLGAAMIGSSNISATTGGSCCCTLGKRPDEYGDLGRGRSDGYGDLDRGDRGDEGWALNDILVDG